MHTQVITKSKIIAAIVSDVARRLANIVKTILQRTHTHRHIPEIVASIMNAHTSECGREEKPNSQHAFSITRGIMGID